MGEDPCKGSQPYQRWTGPNCPNANTNCRRGVRTVVAVAWVKLGLNEIDATFEWMERALEERRSPLVYQKIELGLDILRPDPRFQDLLRRIGF